MSGRKGKGVIRKKPLPPGSVVRLALFDRKTQAWKKDVGRIFRIGYYSRKDGLDCIWLVDESGNYEQTVDHDYLFKYFDILHINNERSLYGRNRGRIPPVIAAKTYR